MSFCKNDACTILKYDQMLKSAPLLPEEARKATIEKYGGGQLDTKFEAGRTEYIEAIKKCNGLVLSYNGAVNKYNQELTPVKRATFGYWSEKELAVPKAVETVEGYKKLLYKMDAWTSRTGCDEKKVDISNWDDWKKKVNDA